MNINIEALEKEIERLGQSIYNLQQTKIHLERILRDEKETAYNKYIDTIDKYLNRELDKLEQNRLYNELDRHKISNVLTELKHLYKYKYEKEDDNWATLYITKKEGK